MLIGLISIRNANALTTDKADGPYDGIVARNVFHLQPALPPSENPGPKTAIPLPKLVLTGITSILGRNVAFITIAGIRSGGGSESVMLAEGQTLNDIEVRSIDLKAGIVQIFNHGEPQTLDFDHNAAKPPDPVPKEFPVPRSPPGNEMRPVGALSPEEQVALIEIQRAKFRDENDQTRNILPPTALSTGTIEN